MRMDIEKGMKKGRRNSSAFQIQQIGERALNCQDPRRGDRAEKVSAGEPIRERPVRSITSNLSPYDKEAQSSAAITTALNSTFGLLLRRWCNRKHYKGAYRLPSTTRPSSLGVRCDSLSCVSKAPANSRNSGRARLPCVSQTSR